MHRIILILSLSFGFLYLQGQEGKSFLLDLNTASKQKNISFIEKQLVTKDASKTSVFQSEIIELTTTSEDFIALSCVLDYLNNYPQVKMFYRIKTDKNWSEWISFEADEHINTEVFKIYGELLYLPKETQALQFLLSFNAGSNFQISKFTYRLFVPSNGISVAASSSSQGAAKSLNCSCPLPNLEYRLDWCPAGTCPMGPNPSPTNVSHLVVHHSAGSNTSPNWAATVRSIWDYHVNTRGWDDIGYNYLIDPNGLIYEGRGNNVSAAHFSCMNAHTMGVCLLGDFTNVSPTSSMLNSLIELMGWKACDIDQDPRETSYFSTGAADLINLCGHRDGNDLVPSCTVTECPGDNVYNIMSTIRNNVYSYSQSCVLNPNYSNIIINSMASSQNPIYATESTDLSLVFKNIGDAEINENLGISFKINGSEVSTSSFSSLNINEIKTVSFPHTFSSAGSYQFCAYIDGASNELSVANNSFCINLEVLERVDTGTAISGTALLEQVMLYPNPAKTYCYIEGLVGSKFEVEIYNELGQLVESSKENLLRIDELSKGRYFVKVRSFDLDASVSLSLVKE